MKTTVEVLFHDGRDPILLGGHRLKIVKDGEFVSVTDRKSENHLLEVIFTGWLKNCSVFIGVKEELNETP